MHSILDLTPSNPADLQQVEKNGPLRVLSLHVALVRVHEGFFRAIGQPRFANDIVGTMTTVKYRVDELNPFPDDIPKLGGQRVLSPYVDRMPITRCPSKAIPSAPSRETPWRRTATISRMRLFERHSYQWCGT